METKDKRPIITANCTHCGKQVKFYLPDKPGILKFQCKNPECGNVFGVNVPKELIDKLSLVTDTTKEVNDWFECPVTGIAENDKNITILS